MEDPYLEFKFYIGPNAQSLSSIGIRAGKPRISHDQNEAIWGEHCCDLELLKDDKCEISVTVSSANRLHLLQQTFMRYREWARETVEECPGINVFVQIDGEYHESDLEVILGVNDCITPSIQDKIDFADNNGYKEGWDTESPNELSLGEACLLHVQSDFGQIQIYDDEFSDNDSLEWDELSLSNFATFSKGAVSLRVMENDDHAIRITLHSKKPSDDPSKYLHIVDVPFSTSGSFDIEGSPITLEKGKYALRWYVSKMNGIWSYQLSIWKSSIKKITVVKQYEQN